MSEVSNTPSVPEWLNLVREGWAAQPEYTDTEAGSTKGRRAPAQRKAREPRPEARLSPYLQDADCTLYHGDVRDVLHKLPAECVDCVVTSPPYWGLRDYGPGNWHGGSGDCDHFMPVGGLGKSTLAAKRTGSYGRCSPESERAAQLRQRTPYRRLCRKCGATRTDRPLGLESTPEPYIDRLVTVILELQRVLTQRGTLWLNLGDTYIKKQLAGIPWRVVLALQDGGWLLRSDVIWAKPNPMPESIPDRPTKAHEYLFLLTKSPSHFFHHEGDAHTRSVWSILPQHFPEAHFATFPEELARRAIVAGCPDGGTVLDPFVGSGTTCYVARKLGRHSLGIDLSAEYLALAARRLQQQSLFAEAL